MKLQGAYEQAESNTAEFVLHQNQLNYKYKYYFTLIRTCNSNCGTAKIIRQEMTNYVGSLWTRTAKDTLRKVERILPAVQVNVMIKCLP